MSHYSTYKGTINSPIRQKLRFFLRKRDFIYLVFGVCVIFKDTKLQAALLGGDKPPFVATDANFASALRKISK